MKASKLAYLDPPVPGFGLGATASDGGRKKDVVAEDGNAAGVGVDDMFVTDSFGQATLLLICGRKECFKMEGSSRVQRKSGEYQRRVDRRWLLGLYIGKCG